ncbi:MAG: prolyl oligopeptidase family serine peptidase [Candidatus Omnitrophica bacterium]|nr:prolyl oligopeptidase family serine peptidase [Candidatus Omnitrophota bacterium]
MKIGISNTVETKVDIINNKGQRLVGILSYPAHTHNTELLPALVLCQGLMDSKDKLKYLASYFCSRGCVVLRFDYANTGESEGRFENLTISQEVSDLNSALDFVSELNLVDNDRIGVIGYSFGGMAAILQTGRDSRIKCLGILAGVMDSYETMKNIFSEEEIVRWNINGYIFLRKLPSLKRYRLNVDFLKDATKYNMLDEVAKVKIPLVFIQGENDRIVEKHQALSAYAKANKPKQIYLLKRCGHGFLNPFFKRVVCKQFANMI